MPLVPYLQFQTHYNYPLMVASCCWSEDSITSKQSTKLSWKSHIKSRWEYMQTIQQNISLLIAQRCRACLFLSKRSTQTTTTKWEEKTNIRRMFSVCSNFNFPNCQYSLIASQHTKYFPGIVLLSVHMACLATNCWYADRNTVKHWPICTSPWGITAQASCILTEAGSLYIDLCP